MYFTLLPILWHCSIRLGVFLALVAAQSASADPEFRVGLALPTTGLAAEYGEAYRNGLRLAQEDFQAEGFAPLILEEDHRYDAKLVLSAARKLVTIDKVNALAVWGYMPSEVVAPLAGQFHIPMLLGSTNSISRGRPCVLNFVVPEAVMLAPLKRHLGQRKFARVALLAAELGTLEHMATNVAQALPKESVLVSRDVLGGEVTEFRSLISRYKAQGAQAILLFLGPQQLQAYVEQSRAVKFEVPIFGMDTLNDSLMQKLFADTAEGPVFTDAYIEPTFAQRYIARFGQGSHLVEAARGYQFMDFVRFLSRQRQTSTDAVDACHSLLKYPAGRGPIGEFHVELDPDFGPYLSSPHGLYQVTQGHSRILELVK